MNKSLIPIITILSILIGYESKAQLGTTLYLSSSSASIGIMYEFDEVMRPEIRIGTDYGDNFLEFALNYDVINRKDYELYAGLSVIGLLDLSRSSNSSREKISGAILVPLGINIYPFENKQFGFHLELNTVILDKTGIIGRWGFRYKFKK